MNQTRLHHVDYVHIKVGDLARICEFYGPLLEWLGYSAMLEFAGVVVVS